MESLDEFLKLIQNPRLLVLIFKFDLDFVYIYYDVFDEKVRNKIVNYKIKAKVVNKSNFQLCTNLLSNNDNFVVYSRSNDYIIYYTKSGYKYFENMCVDYLKDYFQNKEGDELSKTIIKEIIDKLRDNLDE